MKLSRFIFVFNLMTQSTAHAVIAANDSSMKTDSKGRAPAVVYGRESPKQMGKFQAPPSHSLTEARANFNLRTVR